MAPPPTTTIRHLLTEFLTHRTVEMGVRTVWHGESEFDYKSCKILHPDQEIREHVLYHHARAFGGQMLAHVRVMLGTILEHFCYMFGERFGDMVQTYKVPMKKKEPGVCVGVGICIYVYVQTHATCLFSHMTVYLRIYPFAYATFNMAVAKEDENCRRKRQWQAGRWCRPRQHRPVALGLPPNRLTIIRSLGSPRGPYGCLRIGASS